MNKRIKNRRALVLLITMWTLIIMSMLAVQLSTDVRRDLKITRFERDNLLAANLARSGIGIAVCNLKNDLLIDWDPEKRAIYDALSDVWNREPEYDKPQPIGEGAVWYQVTDEESKLNLNVASGPLIYKALLYLGVDEELAPIIATAIVDWRDPDTDVSFANDEARDTMLQIYSDSAESNEDDPFGDAAGGGGKMSEGDFYGYAPRNEHFLVIEELLGVWGVTQNMVYGYDPLYDRPPQHPFPIKPEREGIPPQFDKLNLGLNHLFTTAPTGGLNLNTANFDALAVYFYTGYEEESEAYDMARKVVDWREAAADKFDQSNPHVFKTPDDFTQIPGLPNLLQGQLQMHQRAIVASSIFTIYAEGIIRDAKAYAAAKVSRQYESYPLNREDLPKPTGQAEANPEAQQGQEGAMPPDASNEDNFLFVPAVRCLQWFEW